jgi:hypothetical protein
VPKEQPFGLVRLGARKHLAFSDRLPLRQPSVEDAIDNDISHGLVIRMDPPIAQLSTPTVVYGGESGVQPRCPLSPFSVSLLFFALFSIVSIRERRAFWTSRPGWLLSAVLAATRA